MVQPLSLKRKVQTFLSLQVSIWLTLIKAFRNDKNESYNRAEIRKFYEHLCLYFYAIWLLSLFFFYTFFRKHRFLYNRNFVPRLFCVFLIRSFAKWKRNRWPCGNLVSLDKANKQQLKFNLDTKSVFCLPQGGCIAFQKANKCDLLFSRSRRSSYYSNKKLKTYAHHMAEKY